MARNLKKESREFEDLSSYSSKKAYQKGRKRHGGKLVLKSIAAFFCVLLILFGSLLIYVSTDLISGLRTNAITKDSADLGIDTEKIVLDDKVKNIALFGIDARDDSFRGLSDIIMILTVDNKHRKLKLTSILRDSLVRVEGDSLSGDYLDWDTKITHAYGFGGPELALRTINQNFGLDIEDYATINFTNMAKIVDAFGGVEIELSTAEMEEVNKNLWDLSIEIQLKKDQDEENDVSEGREYSEIVPEDFFNGQAPGLQLLNGNQAVAYARIRYLDGGDDERARRQQKVFRALVSKIKNISFSEYPNLIRQMAPLCETSLEIDDLIGLAPILTTDFTMEAINIPEYEYENPQDYIDSEDVWHYQYDLTLAAERMSSFIWEENSPYWETYGNTGKAMGE